MACARSKSQPPPKPLIWNPALAARSNCKRPSCNHERADLMSQASVHLSYKSPLHQMTQTTPTSLWNDSASLQELTYSIEHGAVGATCNPVIVHGVLKKELPAWKERIRALIHELPTATEDEIAWQLVREISINGAALLKPVFD